MNTTIVLVRHGVTVWNYAGRVQGWSDIPLAPEGERQAEAVAARLAGEGCDAIYSSPLKRALQTAQAVARRAGGMKVVSDSRLIERNFGEAEGMPDVDLPLLWPGVAWDDLPGMEPAEAFVARVHAALADLAARHEGGRIICVAHSSLISRFLQSIAPPGSGPAIFPRPASFTVVRYDGVDFVQETAPDNRHLLEEGVEYTGEKGRVPADQLKELLPLALPSLESVIWGASAVESAWRDGRLVGFARAFTDGVLYGCIDLAAALPGEDQVRPALIRRLQARYPRVRFDLLA